MSSRWSASVSSEGSAPIRASSSRSSAELTRGSRPVAARRAAAHERAVRLLVGGVLAQHLLPPTLGAHAPRGGARAASRAGRESTAHKAHRAAARRHRRSRRHARNARRRCLARRPGRARQFHREARPRHDRRARCARSSRPCASWTRQHRHRASARATQAPRRAACGGPKRAQALSRDRPHAAAPTRRPGQVASPPALQSVRAAGPRAGAYEPTIPPDRSRPRDHEPSSRKLALRKRLAEGDHASPRVLPDRGRIGRHHPKSEPARRRRALRLPLGVPRSSGGDVETGPPSNLGRRASSRGPGAAEARSYRRPLGFDDSFGPRGAAR